LSEFTNPIPSRDQVYQLLQLSIQHGRTALSLESNNPDAMFNLAQGLRGLAELIGGDTGLQYLLEADKLLESCFHIQKTTFNLQQQKELHKSDVPSTNDSNLININNSNIYSRSTELTSMSDENQNNSDNDTVKNLLNKAEFQIQQQQQEEEDGMDVDINSTLPSPSDDANLDNSKIIPQTLSDTLTTRSSLLVSLTLCLPSTSQDIFTILDQSMALLDEAEQYTPDNPELRLRRAENRSTRADKLSELSAVDSNIVENAYQESLGFLLFYNTDEGVQISVEEDCLRGDILTSLADYVYSRFKNQRLDEVKKWYTEAIACYTRGFHGDPKNRDVVARLGDINLFRLRFYSDEKTCEILYKNAKVYYEKVLSMLDKESSLQTPYIIGLALSEAGLKGSWKQILNEWLKMNRMDVLWREWDEWWSDNESLFQWPQDSADELVQWRMQHQ